jgi:hypothetical protein
MLSLILRFSLLDMIPIRNRWFWSSSSDASVDMEKASDAIKEKLNPKVVLETKQLAESCKRKSTIFRAEYHKAEE